MELRTAIYLQFLERGEVLKALDVKKLKFWKIAYPKMSKRRGQQMLIWELLCRHGSELRTVFDIQIAERGEVLKALIVQKLKIWKIGHLKISKRRGQQMFIRKRLYLYFCTGDSEACK